MFLTLTPPTNFAKNLLRKKAGIKQFHFNFEISRKILKKLLKKISKRKFEIYTISKLRKVFLIMVRKKQG